jgi:hypothetical protein
VSIKKNTQSLINDFVAFFSTNVELQKMLQAKNFELLRTKILSLTKIYATSDLVFPLGKSFCFVNTSTFSQTSLISKSHDLCI